MGNKGQINLFVIAFKNLGRHKVKTIITLIAVTISIWGYIVMDAFFLGVNIDSIRNLVNYETGAAKIYSKAYYNNKDERPMYESFKNYQVIINKLSENGFSAAPHEVFGGELISIEQNLPFMFIGIDPDKEKDVLKYYKFVEKGGRFIEKGKFEIVIGARGAKDLNVKVGDAVRLNTVIDKKDEKGIVRHINQLIDLSVCGIINSTNPKNNGNIGYLPLDILQDEMGLTLDGNITEICIRKTNVSDSNLPGLSESPELIKSILGNTLTPELTLVGWEKDAGDYLAITAAKNSSNMILIIFFFFLSLIGIANTILMSVLERTKETGMLRALGMTDGMIIRLFLYEAACIGLIGSLIGVILAIATNFYTVNVGIDMSSLLEKTSLNDYGYRVVGIFRSAWNFNVMFYAIIAGTLASTLTAILPALRSVKITITEALHFE